MTHRTFKYRLRTNKHFVAEAERWLGICCELYNAALQERRDAFRLQRKSVSYYEQQAQLKDVRAEHPELRSMSQGVQADALRRLDKAFRGFFRRLQSGEKAGYPRFRSRRRYESLTFPRMRDGFKIEGDKITFSKLGSVRMRLHRPIEGDIKTATIRRQVDGWYVAFSCEIVQPLPLPATNAQVGVDVGLLYFATLSTGEHVENPRYLRLAEPSLRQAQRRVSRRRRGGNNRRKAIRLLGLRHLKVKRQREAFAHSVANNLIKRSDLIAVEDLNVQGMVKTRHLSKSISDASWSTFINILTYKAENAGRRVVKVPAAFTSQTCSVCGTRQKLDLSQRKYICDCGLDIDRDVNAARNILASASPAGRVAQAA